MNYYEKLGKLYHQLMLNEENYKQTPDEKHKGIKHSLTQIDLKRKIETLMTKELRKENPSVIGVCNVRSVSVHYLN